MKYMSGQLIKLIVAYETYSNYLIQPVHVYIHFHLSPLSELCLLYVVQICL